MRRLFVMAVVVMAAQVGFTKPLDSSEYAKKIATRLESLVMELEGVNGIFVTGCDPVTGAKNDWPDDFVHCVGILTETHEAEERLKKAFPQGTRIDGVFLIVYYVGLIEP